MKVLYDHQIYEHQRIGGVSRYFTEIIKHLPQDVEFDVSIKYSFNEYLKDMDNINFEWRDQLQYHFLPNLNFKGKKRLFSFLEQKFPTKYPNLCQLNRAATIKKLQEGDFDLFHPTFFDDYYLEYLNGKPYVLTVHDTIIELFPEFINSPGLVKRKRKLIEKASHIIAVSENTKQDIINVFGTNSDKISVTYHASSLMQTQNKLENLPDRYLLYVGDRRLGYKNFAFFISSIHSILLEQDDLFLVCTGDYFTLEEQEYFKALDIQDKVQIMFVDDKQMYTLYNKAEMFIYPSYYEGFGIPILEAFQAECPVVLTNSSCFPEVASDAGNYFECKSPLELRAKIMDLLNNQELRTEMIEKGNKRLEQFSWENTAKQTVEIYKKALNNN